MPPKWHRAQGKPQEVRAGEVSAVAGDEETSDAVQTLDKGAASAGTELKASIEQKEAG